MAGSFNSPSLLVERAGVTVKSCFPTALHPPGRRPTLTFPRRERELLKDADPVVPAKAGTTGRVQYPGHGLIQRFLRLQVQASGHYHHTIAVVVGQG